MIRFATWIMGFDGFSDIPQFFRIINIEEIYVLTYVVNSIISTYNVFALNVLKNESTSTKVRAIWFAIHVLCRRHKIKKITRIT